MRLVCRGAREGSKAVSKPILPRRDDAEVREQLDFRSRTAGSSPARGNGCTGGSTAAGGSEEASGLRRRPCGLMSAGCDSPLCAAPQRASLRSGPGEDPPRPVTPHEPPARAHRNSPRLGIAKSWHRPPQYSSPRNRRLRSRPRRSCDAPAAGPRDTQATVSRGRVWGGRCQDWRSQGAAALVGLAPAAHGGTGRGGLHRDRREDCLFGRCTKRASPTARHSIHKTTA